MAEIYEKLRAVQLELNAPKTHYNSFGDYYYRSAEDIEAAVKPLLDKYGLTLALSDDVLEIGGRFYVKATAYLFTENEEFHICGLAREVEEKKKSDPAQITGMASSYARKYALGGMFLVDDQADVDAEERKLTPVDNAKQKLWAAIKAYAAKHECDPKAVLEGVQKRPDYAETVEFMEQVTTEFETAE